MTFLKIDLSIGLRHFKGVGNGLEAVRFAKMAIGCHDRLSLATAKMAYPVVVLVEMKGTS
jgi:hypothetical protein